MKNKEIVDTPIKSNTSAKGIDNAKMGIDDMQGNQLLTRPTSTCLPDQNIIDLTADSTASDTSDQSDSDDSVLVTIGGNPISNKHYNILMGHYWITDEIINSFGLILKHSYPNNYYFSSFFYEKLVKSGPAAVLKWLKQVDNVLEEKEQLFFPINIRQSHWALAVYTVKDYKLCYFDSLMNKPRAMVVLERIEGFINHILLPKQAIVKTPTETESIGIVAYLVSKLKIIDMPTAVRKITKCIPPNQPQQIDGYSCGAFVCKWMEYLSTESTEAPYFQEANVQAHRRSLWNVLLEEGRKL